MLMFKSALVAAGVSASVQIVYFKVGHTHNEVDQRFTCVNTALKKASAAEPAGVHLRVVVIHLM